MRIHEGMPVTDPLSVVIPQEHDVFAAFTAFTSLR